MTLIAGSTATLRHRLVGVLSATGLGVAVTVALIAPSATAAPDPCSASEMARTVGSVAKSAGDYLDGHPATNQAMTTILQQPAGPESVTSLKSYFEANPQVAGDLQTIAQPLTGLSTKCKLPVSVPQMLGLMQQAQGGLPGGLPGAAPAQPVGGAPGNGSAGTAPAPKGPLPGPAAV
ncbi:MAG: hemophore, partial [Mycobacterium sp.]|nr:hemophore [Mycobacterium sp.]